MRKIIILLSVLVSATTFAQPAKQTTKPPAYTVKTDVEKMARDYYGHFFYTKGDKIEENDVLVQYTCKVLPQGAVQSTITQYKSGVNDYSWQADMMNTEDYAKAVAKYKQLYSQLNGSSFAMHDGKTYKIKGDYDAPDESRGFASSILQLEVKERDLRRLKIEVAITYLMPNWNVRLLIYEKDDDEEMRPTEKKEN